MPEKICPSLSIILQLETFFIVSHNKNQHLLSVLYKFFVFTFSLTSHPLFYLFIFLKVFYSIFFFFVYSKPHFTQSFFFLFKFSCIFMSPRSNLLHVGPALTD